MPKYAQYDHMAAEPRPVLGYYDTDFATYPSLPAAEDLIELSPIQWTERTGNDQIAAGGLLQVRPAPIPSTIQSAAAELATRIAAGVAIVSTGNSALNATYALDAVTLDQLGPVARDFASGLGLPGMAGTFTYPDAASVPRIFTGIEIQALYQAMRDMLLVLNTEAAKMANSMVPNWPVQSKTIV